MLSIQIGQLISCLGDLKESLALKDSFLKIKTKTSFYYPPTSVISILKADKSFEREKLIEKFKEILILQPVILNLIFVLYIDHTTNYNSDRTSHFLNTLNTMSQIGLMKEIHIYI